MTQPEFWPGTRIEKSMDNVFTEHLREKRSIFRGDPQFRSNAAPTTSDANSRRWKSEHAKPGRGN